MQVMRWEASKKREVCTKPSPGFPLPVPSLINEDQQRDELIEINPNLGRAAYNNSACWKCQDDAGPLVQRC